jgi:transcriptional regulator with XRE-family HTH domain
MGLHKCETSVAKGGETVHTDMAKLRGKIKEKSLTQEEVAVKIGIDGSTFSRKMKADGLTFTVGQMHKMVDILGLSKQEAIQIFLL